MTVSISEAMTPPLLASLPLPPGVLVKKGALVGAALTGLPAGRISLRMVGAITCAMAYTAKITSMRPSVCVMALACLRRANSRSSSNSAACSSPRESISEREERRIPKAHSRYSPGAIFSIKYTTRVNMQPLSRIQRGKHTAQQGDQAGRNAIARRQNVLVECLLATFGCIDHDIGDGGDAQHTHSGMAGHVCLRRRGHPYCPRPPDPHHTD